MENEQTKPVEQLQLKDLAAIHAAEFPTQSKEVLDSYLEDITDVELKKELETLLQDKAYAEKFDEAITYTAFVIFLLLKKVLGGDDNFIAYLKEYLMSVRDDDKQIKLMRIYFMDVYSQADIVTELLGLSDNVAISFTEEVKSLSQKYMKLLGMN